jgi:subtilisin-like proprotein convertase family protein
MKKITFALFALIALCFTDVMQAQTEIPQANATLTAGTGFVDGDIYTDSGGSAGNYASNELSTLMFCGNPGETIVIDFTTFDVEASGGGGGQCWDNLTISGDTGGMDGTYAGDTFDAGAGLVCMDGTDGAGNPTLGPFTSTAGGCLTFTFDSDASVTQGGWTADITVIPPPPMACGVPLGQPIPAVGTSGAMTPSVAAMAACGFVGTNYAIESVDLDLNHTFDGDLDITLTSPAGTTIVLADQLGGAGDNYTGTVFMDGNPNITTGAPPFTGTFEAEGGQLNTIFAGENINGDWTLEIFDNFGGDSGMLNNFCITFTELSPNQPPIISCPADINANTDAGQCSAVVNFGPPAALDPEGGMVTVTQTGGPPSGDPFPVGTTTVEFTATDECGATAVCTFDVIVTDNEPPSQFDCPADIVVDNDPGVCGAVVNYPDPILMDNCFASSTGTATYDQTINFTNPALMSTNIFSFTGAEVGATADATLEVRTFGDIDNATEIWQIDDEDGGTVGQIGNTGDFNDQCNTTLLETFIIPAATIDAWAADGQIDFTGFDLVGGINTTLCGGDFLELRLIYDYTSTTQPPVPYTVVTGLPSGSTFPVGTTLTTLEYSDSGGNTVQCSFNVTVNDTEAPEIVCVGEQVLPPLIASDAPGTPILDNTTFTETLTVTEDHTITDLNVDIDITHTWTGDITITLESPAGTVVTVFDDLDGCSANDIVTTFDDQSANVLDCDPGGVGTNGNAFPEADYIPSNPLAAFNGESTLGDWILSIEDDAGGDTGTLNAYALVFDFAPIVGTPLDVVLDANGMATINVSSLVMSSSDNCGPVTVTAGGASGTFDSTINISEPTLAGTNIFSFTGTPVGAVGDATLEVRTFGDIDGAVGGTNEEMWTITDEDTNTTGTIGGTGVFADQCSTTLMETFTIPAAMIDTWAADGMIDFTGTDVAGNINVALCGGDFLELRLTYNFDQASSTIDFTCDDVGENSIVVTATDPSGNESTCTATVNVIDDIAPILVCQDVTIELGADGTAMVDPQAFVDTANTVEACGLAILATDVTDVSCADIGTPITVTLFVSDPSGNLASCMATLTVVDMLGPDVTCPADQTVDPGPGNLFYTVPDYFATGEATAVDNCTDPVTVFSQDPAAGSQIPDGVYNVEVCATDEYGNETCCMFELTVESILGNEDSELSNAIVMYPNPAQNEVRISNGSNLLLDNAQIYDVNGKLISTIDLRDMQQEKVIDISALASGVYVVQITGENSSVVKRLIKE